MKEVSTRFDLKDSKSQIAMEGKDAIMLHSADEFKMKAVNDVFQAKLVKRGVPLKGLTYGPLEPSAGSTVKQKITLQQGIPIEKAREIVKLVKNSKKKAQASIQGGRCPDQRQRSRHAAGNYRHGQAAGFRYRSAVHQLPEQLTHLGTTTSINGKEIFDLLRDDIVAIEEQFGRDTVSDVAAITEIGEYLRAGGGKRLRPALLLLSAKLMGYKGDGAIKLASVVEIIHTATLVHDDIIDEAQTRRGRPAANTQWGNSMCVLAGDWLYMQAFKIAVQERNFRILDVLIELTQQMVEGELLQMEKLGKPISPQEHLDLIYRKTACLFSVSMRVGGILGGATEIRKSVWASTVAILASPSRSWMMCSTLPLRKACWASRSRAISAKAKPRCP